MTVRSSNIRNQLSPAMLPRSPRLKIKSSQRLCVTGWHLTPARVRLAWFVARWLTPAMLLCIAWRYWRFENIPEFLRIALDYATTLFGHTALTSQERNWVYCGLYAILWLLRPVWIRILEWLLQAALLKRTTVEFTGSHVLLHRFLRRATRFDRNLASISFALATEEETAWRLYRAKRQSDDRLAILEQVSRCLRLEFGSAKTVVMARFDSPAIGQSWVAVCQLANQVPLRHRAPAFTVRRTMENPDV